MQILVENYSWNILIVPIPFNSNKVINIFTFQFHPRREIVEDDTDSEERNSAEKISEVFDREIQDAQVGPKTLNELQDAQAGDQPVTSIELQSSKEPKQATA